MSRSVKKGPYVEAKLLSRIEAMNEANEKKVLKTSHDRRLRRQEARSRIYHGGHGGLQARRVRSHENVPRSYGEDHVA